MTIQERVKSIIRDGINRKELAGAALLVIKDGKEVLFCEEGYADVEKKMPYSKDTIVRMYSMTKPILSAAAMLLVERGQLDLGDPVSMYIPSFANATVQGGEALKRPVYISDLFAMTAGVSYPGMEDETAKKTDELFNELYDRLYTDNAMSTYELAYRLGEIPLAFQPGTHYRYSTCADIMGAIIEVVTGMNLGEFMKKEFFEPLGMKDTDFVVPEEKQHRQARVYECVNGELAENRTNHLGIRYLHDGEPAFLSGGAGLASTLNDYARFAQMVLNKGELDGVRILGKKTVEMMTSGQLEHGPMMDMWDWSVGRWGYNYGYFNRVLEEPGKAVYMATKGDYGWDGWLGTHYANDPVNNMTILYVTQRIDTGKGVSIRRIRNAVQNEFVKD